MAKQLQTRIAVSTIKTNINIVFFRRLSVMGKVRYIGTITKYQHFLADHNVFFLRLSECRQIVTNGGQKHRTRCDVFQVGCYTYFKQSENDTGDIYHHSHGLLCLGICDVHNNTLYTLADSFSVSGPAMFRGNATFFLTSCHVWEHAFRSTEQHTIHHVQK